MAILGFELLSDDAVIPSFGTNASAMMDVRFCFPRGSREIKVYDPDNHELVAFLPETINEFCLHAGWRAMMPTALLLDIPAGHHVKMYSRSSLAIKKGLMMINSVGVIDEDYKDELKVLLINTTDRDVGICEGDRIAQIEMVKSQYANGINTGYLKPDITRNGGFGSTGR